MSIRRRLLDIASSQVGNTEPTGDDKYIEFFNKEVNKTWALEKNVPWCSIFVTYCLINAGVTNKEAPYTCSCDDGMNWFKQHKQFNTKDSKYEPVVGDIVYYSNTGNQMDSTHVGIVIQSMQNTIKTIEGNTPQDGVDGVRVKVRERASNYILGYGHILMSDEVDPQQELFENTQYVGTGNTLIQVISTERLPVYAQNKSILGYLFKDMTAEVLQVTEDRKSLKVVWRSSKDGIAYVDTSNTQYRMIPINKEPVYKPKVHTVGRTINFTGNKCYMSADADNGIDCTSGVVTITQYAQGQKHPYHVVHKSNQCNVYGWVDEKYLVSVLTSKEIVTCTVTADVLNIRIGAGTQFKKLPQYPQVRKGTKLIILEKVGDWYKISINGHTGYVHSSYVKRT